MSRAAIQTALSAAPGLPSGQSWGAHALDTPQEFPFIVTRWEDKTPAFGLIGPQNLTIWVHDEPGDYTRINVLLEWIKATLTAMIHVSGSDGSIVTQVDWTGDSPDLFDDGWNTITRNATFRIISRAG